MSVYPSSTRQFIQKTANIVSITPINEEEVTVAIVANERDRDKRSKNLMFLIFDKLVAKEDNTTFQLIEACFPGARITIKRSYENKVTYGIQSRVYDAPGDRDCTCHLYLHLTPELGLSMWYTKDIVSFNTIEDLIDHILDNFLI